MWTHEIEPQLAQQCGRCHLGSRFSFATLQHHAGTFLPGDSEANYARFLTLISFDAPEHSRLLGKILPESDGASTPHAGGAQTTRDSALYASLLAWIELEKQARCPDCGLSAERSYLAYVQAPAIHWGIEREPTRADRPMRTGARIMLQPLVPGTLTPQGAPIDFLGDGFCGPDGACDFGYVSASHAGDRLVFECRLSLDGADWIERVRWNICIAEIGPDGRAQNPRFVLPEADRLDGLLIARATPFGLPYSAAPIYDDAYRVRRQSDRHPIFSPDDAWVYYASQGPDPNSHTVNYQTYHGNDVLNHIVAVRLDGSDARLVYHNDGGTADFPFFLQNGNLAFHTWNLERMDRHLYTQSTPDGMMELPILLGRIQGPSMWGKATQLVSGRVLGMTGARRASIENYVPFVSDHTLGTGLDASLPSFSFLDDALYAEILPFPYGYCDAPPDGPNCVLSRFVDDPAYAPDGRAFVAHNPEPTYAPQGESMLLLFGAPSGDVAQQLTSMQPYVPQRLGISLLDSNGAFERVLEPPPGAMLRYPLWVGKRQPPATATPAVADPAEAGAVLHIADLPLWLSFRTGGARKDDLITELDRIVALRVLAKLDGGNACLTDDRPYRFAVNSGIHDHPTHLGINNNTGYFRYAVPAELGGDAFGDIPLAADHSVSVRLPAQTLLLLQGIDAQGHVVRQHDRLFSLPRGTRVDTSVKRAQYRDQCSSCHGSLDPAPHAELTRIDLASSAAMDFATEAAAAAPVDLLDDAVVRAPLTFLHSLRPLLDRACVSCHSGAAPAGELSLESEYSATANYPAGRWATTHNLADADYMAFVPEAERVPGFNYSMSYAWVFRAAGSDYQAQFAGPMAEHQPLAGLAPWDPAYQNLFAIDDQGFVYLSGIYDSNFGRSDRLGGNSRDSWLVELLSGRELSTLRQLVGRDHTHDLSDVEQRTLMALIDVGFPYMARCDERTVPAGLNAGLPWGDPETSHYLPGSD